MIIPSIFSIRKMLQYNIRNTALLYRYTDQSIYRIYVGHTLKFGVFFAMSAMIGFLAVAISVVQLVHHDKLWGRCIAELCLGTFLLFLAPYAFWRTISEWSEKHDPS